MLQSAALLDHRFDAGLVVGQGALVPANNFTQYELTDGNDVVISHALGAVCQIPTHEDYDIVSQSCSFHALHFTSSYYVVVGRSHVQSAEEGMRVFKTCGDPASA